MNVVKTYCDKCGIELVGMDNYEDLEIDIVTFYKQVDLCPKCFEEFTDHIENFFEKREKGKADDEQIYRCG